MRKECCLCDDDTCEGCPTCRTCEGTGTVPTLEQRWYKGGGPMMQEFSEAIEVACPDCHGSGIAYAEIQ
jgi:DnaJ-class molecular chaperone